MFDHRFEITVPRGFSYVDHPFIYHDKSDFEVTYDLRDGWVVLREDKPVAYFRRAVDAFGFIKQITYQSAIYLSDDSSWEC